MIYTNAGYSSDSSFLFPIQKLVLNHFFRVYCMLLPQPYVQPGGSCHHPHSEVNCNTPAAQLEQPAANGVTKGASINS